MDDFVEDEEMSHLGIARRSGRYPWGSGNDPYQRSKGAQSFVDELTKSGLKPTEIAKIIEDYGKRTDPHAKFSTNDLRALAAVSTEEIHRQNVAQAVKLKNQHGHQMSNIAIGNLMGTGESTVRGWLKDSENRKVSELRATANSLKRELESKPFLDVGKGTNFGMGVTATKFNTALSMLKDEGYEVYSNIKGPQANGKPTNHKILARPGSTFSEAAAALRNGELKIVASQSDDGGASFITPKLIPTSLSSKRIQVAYKEDGGSTKDGLIEIRRGIPEMDLGAARYAQVRMAVDGSHYLKGMAVYADDLPAGVDVRFNTNKSKTDSKVISEGKLGAMKPMKIDTQTGKIDTFNPFGASVRQKAYLDKNGREKTSVLNIVNEEGNWDEWSRNLSSQMLSKQSLMLASTQLSKARQKKANDLAEIKSLTNPVLRQERLKEFADSADAAAVHLKAAKLTDQSSRVILPMNSVRPNEIYAPDFDNGVKVVLVRHPHGGPFEIPELTVNNKSAIAKRIIGKNPKDAVGIHHSVAEQLSGADFDGDTVLVIPNDSRKVKTRPPLADLKNFDAKGLYAIPHDDTTTPRMTKKNTQTEMGRISNLITDMNIRGARDDEMARAVKHSMVVIDAEKHGLDYKRSEQDNNISQLKTEYQGGPRKGASTIISRSSSSKTIPEVALRKAKDGGPINPKTGELVWEPTGRTYDTTITKTSKRTGVTTVTPVTRNKLTKGSEMDFVKDARDLMSSRKNPQPMEEVYAVHANAMKALANDARKTLYNTPNLVQSKAAKALYAPEIRSLNDKLKQSLSNAPRERRAQAIARAITKTRIDDDPSLDKNDVKKITYQALKEARLMTGADKLQIKFTAREWEAVQSGAIASTMLRELLRNSDKEHVTTLATPRYRGSLTPGQLARAKQLSARGVPLSEIASQLGIPRSTIVDNIANS